MRVRLAALGLASIAAAVFLELGARFLIHVREIGPSFSVYDPVLGSRHKRGLSASRWTPEFTMRISTNSLGQRGPEPTPADLDAKLRILFLGDSFTEGYGVDDGEEFPRRVAARLAAEGRSVRILNEGVGNTGTGRAVRLLRDYPIEPERATALVYQASSNDFGDDHRDGFFRLDADGRLVEAPLPVPQSFLRRVQPVIDRIPGLTYSRAFAALLQVARSRAPGAGRSSCSRRTRSPTSRPGSSRSRSRSRPRSCACPRSQSGRICTTASTGTGTGTATSRPPSACASRSTARYRPRSTGSSGPIFANDRL